MFSLSVSFNWKSYLASMVLALFYCLSDRILCSLMENIFFTSLRNHKGWNFQYCKRLKLKVFPDSNLFSAQREFYRPSWRSHFVPEYLVHPYDCVAGSVFFVKLNMKFMKFISSTFNFFSTWGLSFYFLSAVLPYLKCCEVPRRFCVKCFVSNPNR